MNWDDLRFVLEVSRTGGVTTAAKRLGVAHTTVYRRIQALEEQTGIVLFERRGTAYKTTGAALSLVELAEEMEERILVTERQLGSIEGAPSGAVRVTTVAALAERLGPHIERFRNAYPDIVLSVRAENAFLPLAKGEADIAVRVCREPPERLVGRRVGDIRFRVFGSASAHQAETTSAAALGQRPDLRWVALESSQDQTPQGRWEQAHVDTDRVVFRTNVRTLFTDAVRRGLGVGLLPVAIGDADKDLVPLSEHVAALALPLWVLTHEDLRRVPRIRATLDFLAETLQDAREAL